MHVPIIHVRYSINFLLICKELSFFYNIFCIECVALGLQGACCPTAEGTMLSCCDSKGISDEWKSYIHADLAGKANNIFLLKHLLTVICDDCSGGSRHSV